MAQRLGLGLSGASDYHGTGKPNRLGEHSTSDHMLAKLLDRAAARPEVRRFIMGRAMARTDRTVEALRALGKPFHSHSGHSVALSHLLMVDFTLGD